MLQFDTVTVLTTHERADWYRGVFGAHADYKFDPRQTMPLDMFLNNLTIGGGSLVVVDEAHVISADAMLAGIKRYVDDPRRRSKSLRIMVVCSKRGPKDRLLAVLAGYCGIYDLIYGVTGADVSVAIERLLDQPNSRLDVLELLDGHVMEGSQGLETTADASTKAWTEVRAEAEARANEKPEASAGSIEQTVYKSLTLGRGLKIQVFLEPAVTW